ncbi:MAG: molybdopterin-guanine dinucleotide biosynthesis protein B, partial [Candidatus Binatia bacterium]
SSLTLDQLVSALGATDIVLVEGFHQEPRAKIEVLSDCNDESLCKLDDNLLAFVTPRAPQTTVPTFEPTNIKPLVDLIERQILNRG